MTDPPTEDDLKRLPLRSIVAYAVRCARRVRPLHYSDNPEHVQAVDSAIEIAEQFATGGAAVAVVRAAAARAPAAYAADACATAIVQASVRDFERLLALTKERGQSSAELGDPVDVSETGPLGSLWPGEEPCGNAELVVEIVVPAGVSDEEVLSAVGELAGGADDLHRALGGKGLKIERVEIGFEAAVPEGVPGG
ncbi:MAG: hypothetical protein HQ582_19605 [Planctomycetes bacterium]|nr:hypothetical protein [Planctomycetota bacterium]